MAITSKILAKSNKSTLHRTQPATLNQHLCWVHHVLPVYQRMTFLCPTVHQAKKSASHTNLYFIERGVFRFVRHQELAGKAQTPVKRPSRMKPKRWDGSPAINNHMDIKLSRSWVMRSGQEPIQNQNQRSWILQIYPSWAESSRKKFAKNRWFQIQQRSDRAEWSPFQHKKGKRPIAWLA